MHSPILCSAVRVRRDTRRSLPLPDKAQPSTPDPRARVSKRQFDRALSEWWAWAEFRAVPAPRAIPARASDDLVRLQRRHGVTKFV